MDAEGGASLCLATGAISRWVEVVSRGAGEAAAKGERCTEETLARAVYCSSEGAEGRGREEDVGRGEELLSWSREDGLEAD